MHHTHQSYFAKGVNNVDIYSDEKKNTVTLEEQKKYLYNIYSNLQAVQTFLKS